MNAGSKASGGSNGGMGSNVGGSVFDSSDASSFGISVASNMSDISMVRSIIGLDVGGGDMASVGVASSGSMVAVGMMVVSVELVKEERRDCGSTGNLAGRSSTN